MLFKSTNTWHRNQDLNLVLFLGQKFDELFFDYTLDTYKPPALNPSFICREALSLINEIESETIDRNNLSYVLEELEWALRNDIVAKEMLTLDIDNFILKDENLRLGDVRLRLEVLERVLNPLAYFELCREMLVEKVSTSGSKKEISHLATLLASLLINIGISKQHIYEKAKEFFFSEKELTSVEDLNVFFESISPTHHHFEIFFLVSNEILMIKDAMKVFDIKVITELPNNLKVLAREQNLKKKKEELWVQVESIETYDRHTARRSAEARLEMVSDLFSLYAHKGKIKWRYDAIITQCCEDIDRIIKKAKSPMDKCVDEKPRVASKKLDFFLKNISLNRDAIRRFNRVVDLHSTALESDLPENQLINIWIAIETIVPSTVHGGGKVKKICNALEPILLKKYVNRLLINLIKDLIKWGRSKLTNILKKVDNYENKKIDQLVLELIALDRYNDLRQDLYRKLDNFHLLRYRVFEMAELFRKPKNVIDRIALHEKKVRWQLRRIYRTRNLIVHSGNSLPYIDTLIENSHDYLDQTMNSVVEYSCGTLDAKTLEQVFEMAKLDYDFFSKELNKIEKFDENNLSIFLI
ncbi:hypothetical protein F889_01740 [Acinetobacter colistiniresistens]|uniref:Apea-like HEPN domain-containing protein n=1 Tax=Acinetobacter colistiniresistens TaxID=280145 RepID=N9PLW0_9GAMM|nr:hypothetical protein [Acinetobacter colistiniresistens]ENX34458.1 hypothetical protein F889_01740 [Acinetobacter colistiniresistens]